MSMRSRPAQASMAADPVSPEVAPTMVMRAIALGQDVIEQAAEHLHRHVLEGERRAVEQFLHEQVGFELDQGDDGGVAEAGVGVAADGSEGLERDRGADKGVHDPGGEFGVGQASHRSPVGGGKMGPGFRHEQAAVLGETGEQDIGEIAGGGLAAGGNVAHGGVLRG